MEFFTTKCTKHFSRQPEFNLHRKDISSKIFIYKHPSLNKVPLLVPRHLDINSKITKSSSQLSDSDSFTHHTTSPSIYSDNQKINSTEHLTPKPLKKPLKIIKPKIKTAVDQKIVPTQRRKFNSYSKNPDIIDFNSCNIKRRRHLSTNHRHKKSEEGKLENLKDHLKVFHKTSKILLKELKKNVFGK